MMNLSFDLISRSLVVVLSFVLVTSVHALRDEENQGRWNKPYDDDTWTWHLAFQSMTLAEYYLRTEDRSVLETLDSSLKLLRRAQWKLPIHHWKSKQIKNIDQEIIDKHQALYEGGFAHAP